MARFLVSLLSASSALLIATTVEAAGWHGLFDVGAREALLQTPEYAPIRSACTDIAFDEKWLKLKPIAGLTTTEGYGSDNEAEDFSWAVMVLSGRALAGDGEARKGLSDLMLTWAKADAFGKTEDAHDAYYALKRQLLPISVAYAILQPSLDPADAETLRNWIDPLVRKIDKLFDREVDRNNHRVLADSVIAVWGSLTGDENLLEKGLGRYDTILSETRIDGTLELEARRGSRALWYQRQTLSSMVVLAETAKGVGTDLYGRTTPEGRSFSTLLGALMNGLSSPGVVLVHSAENHIPGPEKDFLKADLGFLETRGHGRHYMAWTEALHDDGGSLSLQRLDALFARDIRKQRPLIDEFAGGNATCFWGRP